MKRFLKSFTHVLGDVFFPPTPSYEETLTTNCGSEEVHMYPLLESCCVELFDF